METREIPKSEWKEFFDSFSRRHHGKLMNIDSVGGKAGLQRAARNLPLIGLVVQTRPDDETDVEVILGNTLRTYQSHTVFNARHVRVAQWDNNCPVSLEIEAADGYPLLLHVEPRRETLAQSMIAGSAPAAPVQHPHLDSRRLDRAEWLPSFEKIIRRFRGRPVSVQQFSAQVGLESIVSCAPLLALTADQTREGQEPTVRVKLGLDRATVTEFVAAPSKVTVTRSDGIETSLRVESDTGQRLLLEFESPCNS